MEKDMYHEARATAKKIIGDLRAKSVAEGECGCPVCQYVADMLATMANGLAEKDEDIVSRRDNEDPLEHPLSIALFIAASDAGLFAETLCTLTRCAHGAYEIIHNGEITDGAMDTARNLAPVIDEIRNRISETFGVDPEQVSVLPVKLDFPSPQPEPTPIPVDPKNKPN